MNNDEIVGPINNNLDGLRDVSGFANTKSKINYGLSRDGPGLPYRPTAISDGDIVGDGLRKDPITGKISTIKVPIVPTFGFTTDKFVYASVNDFTVESFTDIGETGLYPLVSDGAIPATLAQKSFTVLNVVQDSNQTRYSVNNLPVNTFSDNLNEFESFLIFNLADAPGVIQTNAVTLNYADTEFVFTYPIGPADLQSELVVAEISGDTFGGPFNTQFSQKTPCILHLKFSNGVFLCELQTKDKLFVVFLQTRSSVFTPGVVDKYTFFQKQQTSTENIEMDFIGYYHYNKILSREESKITANALQQNYLSNTQVTDVYFRAGTMRPITWPGVAPYQSLLAFSTCDFQRYADEFLTENGLGWFFKCPKAGYYIVEGEVTLDKSNFLFGIYQHRLVITQSTTAIEVYDNLNPNNVMYLLNPDETQLWITFYISNFIFLEVGETVALRIDVISAIPPPLYGATSWGSVSVRAIKGPN
jgi:hypothetical protein